MKLFNTTLLSATLIAATLASCTKPKDGAMGPMGATGPNGPALNGTLEGYVDLFDQYGNLISNASSVYVTVPGKTGTDSTSAAGIFTKALTTGTYEVDFTKTGYGAMKIPSLNFVGGGTQYINAHIQLTQPASFSLLSATSGTVIAQGLSAVSVTVTPSSTDTKARKVICFFSSNNAVSYTPGNYMGAVTINIPANATSGTGNISTAIAYEGGVSSGSAIYISAYPISVNNNASTYGDIVTGKTIYNNINTASSVTTNTIVP